MRKWQGEAFGAGRFHPLGGARKCARARWWGSRQAVRAGLSASSPLPTLAVIRGVSRHDHISKSVDTTSSTVDIIGVARMLPTVKVDPQKAQLGFTFEGI